MLQLEGRKVLALVQTREDRATGPAFVEVVGVDLHMPFAARRALDAQVSAFEVGDDLCQDTDIARWQVRPNVHAALHAPLHDDRPNPRPETASESD